MLLTERHAPAAQSMRSIGDTQIHRIRRHERDMTLSARPAKTQSFFGTAWKWISSFLPRRKIPATPKTSILACNSVLKIKTCQEIRNGYFNALYRKEFANELAVSPTEFVSLQQDYDGKHADLRKSILQDREFLGKFKALPEAARFYLAEIKAHERQLYADAYPPVFMSRMESVVEKLQSVLIQSFGVTQSNIAAGREIVDTEASRLASECFSKIRDVIPQNMRLRIPPAARLIYCDVFHDVHVKLRQGIWDERFPVTGPVFDYFMTRVLKNFQNDFERKFHDIWPQKTPLLSKALYDAYDFAETRWSECKEPQFNSIFKSIYAYYEDDIKKEIAEKSNRTRETIGYLNFTGTSRLARSQSAPQRKTPLPPSP